MEIRAGFEPATNSFADCPLEPLEYRIILVMQAQLSLMFAHNKIMAGEEHRREMEQMKREITEDVLSRISIRLEDEALKQLRDMLNDLGK